MTTQRKVNYTITVIVALFTALDLLEGFVAGVKDFFEGIPLIGATLGTASSTSYIALGALILLVILNTTLWKRPGEEAITKDETILGKFGDSTITLVKGNIQDTISLGRESVILLPANTAFTDDCITDKNSAMGAYFMENYPGKEAEAISAMQKELAARGHPKNLDGDFAPGTAILMPPPFDHPVKLVIAGTTVRRKGEGISAEPSSIAEAIHGAFAITSDLKISKLRMPILGSGNGGMSPAAALNVLVYAAQHYLGKYHHVKSVQIVSRQTDTLKLRLVSTGQYSIVVEAPRT